jgi:predicted RNA-binding protein YlxR (DUF448 family)
VAPKPELLRLAAVGEDRAVATLDRTGTLPGRGAYLCRDLPSDNPKQECASIAGKRGGLQRAFRRAVEVPGDLVGSLESESQ